MLFPPPQKPSGCDFKQWIDNYMMLKDIEYVVLVRRTKLPWGRVCQAASSLMCSSLLLKCYFIPLRHARFSSGTIRLVMM
jgi:hypothetical protein